MEIYVLLLLSIDLFLRRSEYSSLSDKNFNTNLFLLTDAFVIEALNISVKGKKTNRKERRYEHDTYACWRKLWVYGDDVCGDVDTKRHLLAFLYAINWRGGYIFPTKKELANPPVDGVYKTFVDELTLLSTLKSLFTTVIKRSDKLTSQSGRKTGYLWGTLRGASVEQNMQAADHVLFTTANKYLKDAEALATIIGKVNDPKREAWAMEQLLLCEWGGNGDASDRANGAASSPFERTCCRLHGEPRWCLTPSPPLPRARVPHGCRTEVQKAKEPLQRA
jgi:hypothetical protein